MHAEEFIKQLYDGVYDLQLKQLYGNQAVEKQKIRYENAVLEFKNQFPQQINSDISVFSAPGRTEIGGNHTDHQHGCVLAAAVNLDVIAVVSFHDDNMICVKSEGYPMDNVCIDNLSVRENEKGTSAALIRGIAAQFSEMGAVIGGFNAYTTSDVVSGSGLSSSAAFEILIGTIINNKYFDKKSDAVRLAQIGQYAENVYYGKKSGLMDQMVSANGGLVFIDFKDTVNPEIQKHSVDLSQFGYEICITDTKGSHSDLTDDYVAVSSEMKQAADYFNCCYLREVAEENFINSIPELRKTCSDRAVLRSLHFFEENRRAYQESVALQEGNMEYFLGLMKKSGSSSANLLQNLYSVNKPTEQAIPLAIAVSKKILNGEGAVRVHGGGFAGTIQAVVPANLVESYKAGMEKLFGKDCCYVLRIRPCGGVELTGAMEDVQ